MCLSAMVANAQPWQQQQVNDTRNLKDAFKDYFMIGVAVNMRNITDEAQIALVKKEFNSITAENDMKPISVHPEEGKWT